MKTIIWCCFAADVDVVMLESEERPTKEEEERFGVQLALKYRSRWDRPFFDVSIRLE